MNSYFRIFATALICFFVLSSSFSQMDSVQFESFVDEVTRLIDDEEFKDAITFASDFRINNYTLLNCRQKGKVSDREGVAYYRLYDDAKAVELWIDSTAMYWADCEDVDIESWAKLYYKAGNSYSYLRNYREAANYFSKSLDFFTRVPSIDEERFAERQLELAKFYIKIEDSYNAELLYEQVYKKIEKNGSDKLKTYYYSALVFHHSYLLEHENVIENGLKSIVFLEKEQKYKNDLVTDYLNISYAYYSLGNPEAAYNYLSKIKNLYKKYDFEHREKEYQNLLPLVLAKLSRQKEAIQIYQEAIKEYQKDDKVNQKKLSHTYENLADILKGLHKHNVADSLYFESAKFYLPGLQDIKTDIYKADQTIIYPQMLISTLSNKAHNKILQFIRTKEVNLLNEANNLYKAIDFLFARERNMINQFEQKAILSDQIKSHLNQAVDAYYLLFVNTNEIKYLEEAYKYASFNKSLLMREANNMHRFISQNITDSLLQKEEELLKNINQTYQAIQNSSDGSKVDSLNAALILYRKDKEKFFKHVKSLYQKNGNTVSNDDYPTLTLSEIQEELKQGEVVLDYYFTKESLYVFVIAKNEILSHSLENDEALRKKINNFRSNIVAEEAFDQESSISLCQLLVNAVVDDMNDPFDQLYIIPDEILLKVPFEAFMKDDKYLIELVSISYLNANAELKSGKGEVKRKDYLGLGSSYSKDLNKNLATKVGAQHLPLNQLLNAEAEIQQSAEFWNAKTLFNENASKNNFIANLQDASIVHLALHGLLDDSHPQHSAIAFDDRNDESILNTNELYSLQLSNQLTILSTCSSGEGEIYKSEGSQSLAKGFAIAGCPAILSSLWSVYDKPTSDIITKFNELLSQGKPKHKALQEAKLYYLETAFATKRSPKYWSNLILSGNTEPIEKSSIFNKSIIILSIILLLLIGFVYYRRKPKNI